MTVRDNLLVKKKCNIFKNNTNNKSLIALNTLKYIASKPKLKCYVPCVVYKHKIKSLAKNSNCKNIFIIILFMVDIFCEI